MLNIPTSWTDTRTRKASRQSRTTTSAVAIPMQQHVESGPGSTPGSYRRAMRKSWRAPRQSQQPRQSGEAIQPARITLVDLAIAGTWLGVGVAILS